MDTGSTTTGGLDGVAGDQALRDVLTRHIRDVADWPTSGVVFKDISPLLGDPAAFGALVGAFADLSTGVDKIVGIEARGFILASPVACRADAGFVPVRKAGKLPRETYTQSYDLEYGSAVLEVHQDAFRPGDRVIVIDDVLATGGTVGAAVELIRRAGADVAGVAVLLELGFLGGRERLAPLLGDIPLTTFLRV